MTDPAPRIDFANLPAPAEGILVTLFITVRMVARSRDFYSRVLGGTVVLDENPCMVRLSNSWIIMNPGGPRPRLYASSRRSPRRRHVAAADVVASQEPGGAWSQAFDGRS